MGGGASAAARKTEKLFQNARHFAERALREQLPQDLLFHSAEHTLRDVLPAAELLAAKMGVSGDDLLCLRVGALFHDIGYIEQYERNEPVGAAWAERHLPGLGFSAAQVAKVCQVILATQMPQKPTTLLGEIICDADLKHLGGPDFFERTEMLRREIGLHAKPPKDIDRRDWARGNISFLEGHAWFTSAAREMWTAGQQENLLRTKEIAEGKAAEPPSE